MRTSRRSAALVLLLPFIGTTRPAWGQAKAGDANEQARVFVKTIAMHVMPTQHEDRRKWGLQKEIVSGLNVRLDGLRLRTKRRRKKVNHGSWSMYRLEMDHPQKEIVIQDVQLRSKKPGSVQLHIVCEAHVKTHGRYQNWRRGVRLLSVSASGDAKIRLTLDCSVAVKFDITKLPPDVELDPKVTRADLELLEFRLNRVGNIGGEIAQQLAKGVKHVLDDQIEKKRQKLVSKVNRQIDKRRDRLKISLSDYAKSQWGKHFGTKEQELEQKKE